MDNKQKKLTLLGILLVGCLLTSVAGEWAQSKRSAAEPALPSYVDEAAALRETTIKVYVSGAVMEPGLYDLPTGARAWQAVEAAGGLRENANVEKVNLAKKLKDGNQVNVPALKAASGGKASGTGGATDKRYGRQGAPYGGRLNLNRATAAELDGLPGIGPAMARRIIERRQVKRFTKVDDLLQVKGMGQAKLARLRDLVEVD